MDDIGTDGFNYLLSQWSRVLLRKLNGFQLVKKFMETEGSLPHSQAPPPVPILSQLDQIYASSTFHFLKIQVNIILQPMPASSFHLARDLPTCTAVPQNSAPPRSPFSSQYHLILLPALLCTLFTSHCQIQDSIRLYLALRLPVIVLGSPGGDVRLVTSL